jgi:putative RNA 2'-phosphotransferase
VNELSRFMLYMLGYRPDEFGLLPDEEGFLTFKELLWALHEEPGWGYVREGHIREVLLGKDRSSFEWEEERIRAAERRWALNLDAPALEVPKLLFVGVRRRAHARVMEKGLWSPRYLVLSPDRDMAVRMAIRRDQKPVILEVMTTPDRNQAIAFYAFGDLFLATHIPPSCIAGPPVAREVLEARELARTKKEKPLSVPDFTPGSFVLDLSRDPDRARRVKGRKPKGWKEDSRKMRREKR